MGPSIHPPIGSAKSITWGEGTVGMFFDRVHSTLATSSEAGLWPLTR
jgi:hypothetical protein